LKVIARIETKRQASNRGMMGFGFLQDNNPIPANDHKQLVPGFHAQGLARVTWDHYLILGRNSHFSHRFTS
jgi:hypothetical protein